MDLLTLRERDSDDLPGLAHALDVRLHGRAMELHEDWILRLRQAGLDEALSTNTPSGGKLRVALFERICGPVPALPRLACTAGQWSMLAGEVLLVRLCALALLGRPGVLRCCVQRHAREALADFLGPAFPHLIQSSMQGGPVHEDTVVISPLSWACVGYMDLARQGAWPTRSLRRLVRLALPCDDRIRSLRHLTPTVSLDTASGMRTIDAWFRTNMSGTAVPQ